MAAKVNLANIAIVLVQPNISEGLMRSFVCAREPLG